MKRKLLMLVAIMVTGLIVAAAWLYIENLKQDVVATEAEVTLSVSDLVGEYLADAKAANATYLAADGESKVVAISGTVHRLSSANDGRTIVVLKQASDPAGFQCLMAEGQRADGITEGGQVTIKGVLRAGPGYDEDLELYENGYLEDCTVLE